MQDFQAGRCNLVLLCPPAASFNRAAFATSSGPAPVRDARWPEGYPWLQGRQKLKAQRGIQHIRRALELVRSADSLHVPWLWEHPEHLGATARGTPASVWTWPETQKFFLQSQANTVVLAQCAYRASLAPGLELAHLVTLVGQGWIMNAAIEDLYPGTVVMTTVPLCRCQVIQLRCARPWLVWLGRPWTPPRPRVWGGLLFSGPGRTPRRMHWQLLLARCHRRTQRRWQLLYMCRRNNKSWISLRCCLRTILLEGNYKQAPKHSLWAHMLWVEACLEFERRTYPEVAKLLCRFVESLKQGFEFMAVALFRDLRTLPHRDLGNQQGTCNLVAGLSGFRAGGVWVSSDSGAVPCPFEGFSECGDVLPVSGTFAIFDPRHLRCTMEWQGSRVVLVAYCPFPRGAHGRC